MTPADGPTAGRLLRAALALAALLLLLIGDACGPGRIFFERDVHMMYWGQARSFQDAVGAGLPLWDAYRGFGEPMLANPNAQTLYPWTWLTLAVSPLFAYGLFAISHLLLAGAGLIFLGRRLGVSWTGSVVMAAVGIASGPLVSLVNLWHHLAGAAWMPWAIGAAESTLRSPSRGRTLAWGSLLAIQALAGSADMCLATAVLTLVLPFRHVWRRPQDAATRRALGAAALAAGLAVGLTAALWMPALHMVRTSERAALPELLRTYWSVNPWTLLQTVVPLFPQMLRLQPEVTGVFYDPKEPFLGSIYLGAAALPLVAASLLGTRRRLCLALAVLGLLAVGFSLGRFGVVYEIAVWVVPPLGSFRYPSKAMVAVAYLWALLAGFGFDAWVGHRSWDRVRAALVFVPMGLLAFLPLGLAAAWWGGGSDLLPAALSSELSPAERASVAASIDLSLAAAGAITLLALALAACARNHWATPRFAALLLASCAVADLVLAHRGLNATADALAFASPPAALAVLKADRVERLFVFDYAGRVLGKTYRRSDPVVPRPEWNAKAPAPLRAALAYQAHIAPPLSTRWAVRGSYEHDWMGLKPKPLRNLMLVLRATEEMPEFQRLLEVGGVTHVVALHAAGLEALSLLASIQDPQAGNIRVYRVPDPMPRAYAVGSARGAEGLDALRLLTDATFDPRREVILADERPAPTPPFAGLVPARWIRASANHLRLEADLPADGYLVVLDAHDPGWSVFVDQKAASLLRANVGFRGVRVPRGRHVIDFDYWPPGLTAGLWVTAAAMLVAAAVSPAGVRWRRRAVASPPAATS